MSAEAVMTVVAGPRGAGKTTVLSAMDGEAGFPTRRIVEQLLDEEAASEALLAAIANRESFVVETALDSPTVLSAMARAAERGIAVELVIVDVDSPELLRARRDGGDVSDDEASQQRYRHHLPAAVDLARRVLLIDNSATLAIPRELSSADLSPSRNVAGPRWIAEKVIAPKLQRMASRVALRQLGQSVGAGQIKPFIQAATPWGKPSRGVIVGVTQHHALQRVGQALHLVHDLGLLPMGAPTLIQGAIAAIAYEAKAHRGEERTRQAEAERNRGPQGEHAERERERGDRSPAR